MRNKFVWSVSLIIFVLISTITIYTYRTKYRESHKNTFEFPTTLRVKNVSSVPYLDTLAAVVIHKIFQYDTMDVIMFDMVKKLDQKDYLWYGYIEKMASEPHTYIIFVQPEYVRDDKFGFIIHELIHLEQMETGRLTILPDYSGRVFDGDTVYFDRVEYPFRKYEIEAMLQSKSMRKVLNKLIYE